MDGGEIISDAYGRDEARADAKYKGIPGELLMAVDRVELIDGKPCAIFVRSPIRPNPKFPGVRFYLRSAAEADKLKPPCVSEIKGMCRGLRDGYVELDDGVVGTSAPLRN